MRLENLALYGSPLSCSVHLKSKFGEDNLVMKKYIHLIAGDKPHTQQVRKLHFFLVPTLYSNVTATKCMLLADLVYQIQSIATTLCAHTICQLRCKSEIHSITSCMLPVYAQRW